MPRNAVQPLDKFFNVMSLVAIVGRPNVGKSTLFNRLVGQRQAIVDSTAGTTRDRHYGKTDWNGKEFSVIDTGGYTVNSDDIFEDDIRRQVMLAIDEADVILFLVEVSTGITDLDTLMADILRRTTKKVILVCNKVDNYDQIYSSHEFYKLGLGDPYCISSMSGSGTGDLMDAILEALPAETSAQYEDDLPRITIVGRPNVGKSSLTNALLGVERNIVTPVAGTTRDSIHTRYNKFGMDFYLVDTAGMRKKGKVTEDLEFYSVMRSIRAIENSDVCVLMLDAEQGLESQDLNIHNLIVRNRKGCVIVVNKWDLIEKGNNTMKEWREFLMKKLAPFNDIPIIFTSVLNKQRILEVLQTAVRIFQSRKRRIPTSEFNDYILPVIEETPPPSTKGKYIRIKYAMQLPTPTPQFAFFVNLPQYIKEPYRRFLENKIREQWIAMVALVLIVIMFIFAFVGPLLLGEQDPRAVGFLRRPHAVVFPGEVTAGEILVSTFPPNLPLPALRAASVAAPRHPASGCARLTTRVTKGGFSRHPHAVVFPSETTAGEIRFPTYTNHPPAKRRDLPLPQLPSHQRTTTRGKAKKRSERLFFRTKRPIFIPKVS